MTLTNGDNVSDSDIAIIGMAVRVPGARDIREFWSNLRGGVESIRTLTNEELIANGERPDLIHKKNYVPRTGELQDMEMFDPDFFGLSPKEAAVMDPQHRHFLECAWEAMEDGCRTPDQMDGPIGVFAGCGMGSYFYFNVCSHKGLVDETGLFLLRHTGNDKDFLATRASFAFNLSGPSVNVQTACSTSLVAVHYACQSLLSGECDMALAGGSTIEFPHRRGYLYQSGEVLSPDGHCRAFDHRAAGTVFGSGAGVVALRRLSDAIADGDPIHAVIKSSAINNDGASKAGYLAPSVSGQAAAVVEALAIGDIPADTIQYVECHGTGTYLGDPIEIEALTQAFRQTTDKTGFCRIGSVKTNIGHLDTAAGVASLIKAALALKHEEIPPTLNFEQPNPAINFEASPFVVNDSLTPWKRADEPRRACINSLGVGGTNAHCVLQEAPRVEAQQQAATSDQPQIVVLSAKNPKALDGASLRIAQHLEANDQLSLSDVTYSLVHGRNRFEHTRIVAVNGRDDAIATLGDSASKRPVSQSTIEDVAGVAFLLPGGGTQYPGMGRMLYANDEIFKSTVDEGLSYLPQDLAAEIRELWLGDSVEDAAKRLHKVSLQLIPILITAIATARVLEKWGIKPAALVGHSLGENAAACLAGVLSYRDAVRLAHTRGALLEPIVGGGLLSVAMSHEDLKKRLPDTLDIASVNAPELCAVSGANDELEKFHAALVADEIDVTRIPLDVAAHSRHFEPVLPKFEAFMRELDLSPPKIPILSNVTGTWMTDEQATDPRYWAQHLRSTVLFSDCAAELMNSQRYMLVEVGPGRQMSSLIKSQKGVAPNQVVNTLPHANEDVDDQLHLLNAVGRCWAAGLPVDIDHQWSGAKPNRLSLPTYAFQHQHYFLDAVAPKAGGEDEPLLRLDDLSEWGWRPAWRQTLPDLRLGADEDTGSWLVFVGDTGFATAVVTRLRRAGHRVVTVAPGDTFAKLDDDSYVLCAQDGRPDYIELLRDLAENGGIPDRIVHLDLVTKNESFRPGSTFFNRNQEHGFYSLFYIAQALAEVDAEHNIQITVLTSGMQRVGDEPLPYPEKATVLGPAQVVPHEMPNVSVRVIDLPADFDDGGQILSNAMRSLRKDLNGSTATLLEQCWDDLFAQPGNEIVAYRNGRRWTRTQEALSLDDADQGAARFKNGGVYIVTGGLGDLGTLFAEGLATRFKAKLVLIGRIELPDRETWDSYLATYGSSDRIGNAIAAIQQIEQVGGEVLYVRADVTNADAMTKMVAEAKAHFGQINGVLHTAGVVRDELIPLKDPAEVAEVFAPKVTGTVVLAEALADEPLDLVVLFSSTSADIAPAGQIDYVAANAYLNAFAESKVSKGDPQVVAIHWGIWKDTGLAARSIHQAEYGDSAQTTIATTKSLFFDRRLRDPDGREWLEGRWDASRHWVLEEHRLASGHAIWPGTGYIEVIAHALAEYGISAPYEITDLTFLRPLYVADGEARFVRVSVTRQSGGRHNITIESSSAAESAAGRLLHAEATVKALRDPRREQVDPLKWKDACGESVVLAAGDALESAQEVHLNFGPRWKVLRAIHSGHGQAVAKLEIPDAFSGDLDDGYRLHPALLDIATGYAMDLIPGYDRAASLWVPMSYGSIRVLGKLPRSIWSHARIDTTDDLGDDYAAFDITITDETGRVLVEIDKFTIKRLEHNTDFEDSLTAGGDTDVSRSSVHSQGDELSPAMARLAAQVEQGIAAADGLEVMLRALGAGLPQVIVSSMDLPALQRSAAYSESETTTSGVAFERPDLDSDFVEPRNDIERKLCEFWSELLGVQKIGVHDNFFDLGGHSLIAVRLFRMIKKAYAADFPISVLFEAPTIAQCAELIEDQGASATTEAATGSSASAPQQSYTHLVKMHPGKDPDQTPLFICAGMFGNILNLRQLAQFVGRDRPVYGLQARGLYGDQDPHETFEEMARANLAEVRTIQPEGPYLLAGFSGGGLVAYEMAQLLKASGDSAAIVAMLDTPVPDPVELSMSDRVAIRMQDIEREGSAFLVRYAKWRIAWETQRLLNRNVQQAAADQFHSETIRDAFMRAHARFEPRPYDGDVLMLRPKQKIAYRLSGDRNLNIDRERLRPDNGWSPYIPNLSVIEVPGNHDNMVLEPNVRVLAEHLCKALDDSEWGRFYSIAAE